MEVFEREIWFKCKYCERESYCEAEFKEIEGAEVMCPFCRKMQNLDDCKLGN